MDAAKTYGAAFTTPAEPFAATAHSPLSSAKTAVSIQLDTVTAFPGGAMVPLATAETEPTEMINHCKQQNCKLRIQNEAVLTCKFPLQG